MILVFVGAGGSAAVDPEQYPTTVGFRERLPSEIKDDGLFTSVSNFLHTAEKIKTIDIEHVLGALSRLQEVYKEMGDSASILGWAMAGNLGPMSGYGDFKEPGRALVGWIRDAITPLKDKINEQVYRFYGKEPNSKKLSLWTPLLVGLEKIDPDLEIFTTNYDIVLEKAIEESGVRVGLGLTPESPANRRMKLDLDRWRAPFDFPDRIPLLTKLHGSVDWQHLNEDIIVSTPRSVGNPQLHCILYPGYKGSAKEEPFRTFHAHLRRVIKAEQLTAAIFIGYAFRDDYINDILNNDLPKETPSYFITKGSETDLPPGAPSVTSYSHITQGLIPEVVEGILKGVATDAQLRF